MPSKIITKDSSHTINKKNPTNASTLIVKLASSDDKDAFASSVSSTKNNDHLFGVIPKSSKKLKPVNRSIYEKARITRVYQLDLNDPVIQNIPRGGYLPYIFIDGQIFFCFGQDKDTLDLTDFGGTRKYTENIVQCAVREGNEESRLVFSEITEEQVQGFLCLYSSNMLIILVPVDGPKGKTRTKDMRDVTVRNFESGRFLNKRQIRTPCYNELSAIRWLNQEQTVNLFSEKPKYQMFAKVRRFIYSCDCFSQKFDRFVEMLRDIFISGQSTEPEPLVLESPPLVTQPQPPLVPQPPPLIPQPPLITTPLNYPGVMFVPYSYPYNFPAYYFGPSTITPPTIMSSKPVPLAPAVPVLKSTPLSPTPVVSYSERKTSVSRARPWVNRKQTNKVPEQNNKLPEQKNKLPEQSNKLPGEKSYSGNFHIPWDDTHRIWNYQEWIKAQPRTIQSH